MVQHTLIDNADDNWAPGDFPTTRQSAALGAAQRGLTPQQSMKLSAEVAAKRDSFGNYREQVLWMTKRALEMKSSPASAPAPK